MAAARCRRRSGWGAGASPLISGWTEAHEQLAAELTQFEQVEAVALFPTGFAANLGTIAALVGAGDAVYLDRLNHACLIDGARLSVPGLRSFPHADVDRLEQILLRDRGRFRRRLIATDGIFSMDGDVAPLADLADLAERFDAMLLVDEAHGTGVLGPEGRGAAAACGVANRVPIRVGTLSKALGSVGGFVAGSKQLVSWLVNHARTLIYSTPPPAAAAAAACALQIARSESWRRESIARGASWLEGRLSGAPASDDPDTDPSPGRRRLRSDHGDRLLVARPWNLGGRGASPDRSRGNSAAPDEPDGCALEHRGRAPGCAPSPGHGTPSATLNSRISRQASRRAVFRHER
ncbi:MAG: aminotransferase class I/II-fold pyridoxal phosphate-dependent enzyme [Isosphaeraceae bacterium]